MKEIFYFWKTYWSLEVAAPYYMGCNRNSVETSGGSYDPRTEVGWEALGVHS
jgi:hypothetical protein